MTAMYNLVEKLTREHKVSVHTDDGIVFATKDGLLKQLRDAMFGDNSTSAYTGSKTRLPINAPATDLFQLIDRQIAEVWSATTGRVPNTDKPETLLTEWASAVNPEKLVTVSHPETIKVWDEKYGDHGQTTIWPRTEYTPQGLLERWTKQIEELFDPPRTAEIKAACITCGEREVWRRKDGEDIRSTALIFIRDRETGESTEARCQACGTSWAPAQFLYLAEAIAANETQHAEEGTTRV